MLYLTSYDEPVTLPNLDKPIFFCDVDGVLNALPFERTWTGTEKIHGVYDPALWDSKNWRVDRVEPDIKKSFALDQEPVVLLNKNHHYDASEPKFSELQLRYSSTLIKRIRRLITEDKIAFVWLTSWKTEAVRLLNTEFGFPETTPFLDWATWSDLGQARKGWALLEFLESLDQKVPWVWVDDVATENYVARRYHDDRLDANFGPRLIIQTDPMWGINRNEMSRIEKFVHKHSR